MKYVGIGWTRHGAEVFLSEHRTWIKEKYIGFAKGGFYHTVPIAVFDTAEAAKQAIDMSDEITSCEVTELTDALRERLTGEESENGGLLEFQ